MKTKCKQLFIQIACFALFFVPMMSTATPCSRPLVGWQIRPYAGVDAQWRHMKYLKGLGDNLFKSGYPQGNIYLGLRVHDYFGFEAGFETTPTRTRTATLGQGDTLLGIPVRTGDPRAIMPPVINLTKNRIKGWHTGIMGYLPVCDWFGNPIELLGYVGQARLKAVYQNVVVYTGLGPQNYLSSVKAFTRKRSVLKLGIGSQYTFGTNGIRFMLGYENTRLFDNLKPKGVTSAMRLTMRNSLIYSVGVFIITP